MRRTAIAAALVIVAACGCVKERRAVLIAAEGDSTTYGEQVIGGISKRTASTTPALLQAALRARLDQNIRVENRGVRGATAAQILNGTATYIGSYAKPYAEAVKSDPAQIVIFNFAINDSAPTNHESTDDYRAALTQLVKLARGAGKVVVLEEPNPVVGNTTLSRYVAAINQVAAEQGVPVIQQFAHTQTFYDWPALLTDGIHPDDRLYSIKAQREYEVIAPLVRSLQ